MSIITIAIIVIITVLIMIFILKPRSKTNLKTLSFLEIYSERGKVWINQMRQLYDSGLTWEKDQVKLYEKQFQLDLPLNEWGNKVSAYWADLGVPENYLDQDENSAIYKAGSYFHDMQMRLNLRSSYQHQMLTELSESEVMSEHGLNINSGEVLYYHATRIDWYEEKTVRTNVAYSGFRYRSGGNMSFSSGMFSSIKNDVKNYVLLDRGTLYITNKRIIFIGAESRENRNVKFDELLELSFYNDGILLGKSTGKKPLLYVADYENGILQRDILNQVIRVIYRIMSNTQNKDLTPHNYES